MTAESYVTDVLVVADANPNPAIAKFHFTPLSGRAVAGTRIRLAGTENVISKDVLTEGSYCHIKFAAIEERTLSWKRPVLKDASEGDIIDFYGPCNHDPLGKEEIQSQKRDLQRRFEREYGS